MKNVKLFEFKSRDSVSALARTAGLKRGLVKRDSYFASGALPASYFYKLAKDNNKQIECSDLEQELEIKKLVENVDKSFKTESDSSYFEGLFDYQKAGVDLILNRKFTLLADEMGLGKTIQAITAMHFSDINDWVVACPSSLKYNWLRECQKWIPQEKTNIEVIEKSTTEIKLKNTCNIFIMSYEVIRTLYIRNQLTRLKIGGYVVDEAHFLKSPKAERTKAVLNLAKNAKKCVAITGTPLVNRPIELFPILKKLSPDTISPLLNRYDYGRRFCNAFRGKWGWDDTGSSREEELSFRLRATCMIRRKKNEVLEMLPSKFHKIISLSPSSIAKKLLKKEKEFDKDNLIKRPELGSLGELAQLRRTLAETKFKTAVEYIQSLLEEAEKVVIFCYHRDMIEWVESAFSQYRPAIIHGSISSKDRQREVDRFQNEKKCRLFIGQINASGVGLTLTSASHVVFMEMDWSPSVIDQCIDRCHRIGQKDNVTAHYIVVEGSLDEYMVRRNLEKKSVINNVLG